MEAEYRQHEEGHHVAGSGRDRTDFRHAGTFVTDAAAFRPVAAAFAASDVVPARLTPDSVIDAERHDSPTRRSAITNASVSDAEVPLRTWPGVFVAEPRRAATPLSMCPEGTSVGALNHAASRAITASPARPKT